MNTIEKNPLLCDPVSGVCEMPGSEVTKEAVLKSTDRPLKLVYFTDPICSSCWGIEPQLRKLKLEYGQYLDIDYRMGGLLPDWDYNSGGIGKPSDVATHWDEASIHYDMPIDGDVWLEDPLDSSYPPSIAFKAAQMQDTHKADLFMRALRELLFLQKKNIAKWEHIATAALSAGLNVAQLKNNFEGKANELFEEDLKMAKDLGVRGFPTIFFIDEAGNKELVYGSRPYAYYEMAILKLYPFAKKSEYHKTWESLFSKYNSLTVKEFSELSGTPSKETEQLLNNLTEENILEKRSTKNGSMWTLKLKGA